MIKEMLLFLFCFVGAASLVLHVKGVSVPLLVSNVKTQMVAQLQPLITFIQRNAPFVGVAFTAVSTAGALIIRKIRGLMQAKDDVTAQAKNWQTQAFETASINVNLQKTVESQQAEIKTQQEKIEGLEKKIVAQANEPVHQQLKAVREELERERFAYDKLMADFEEYKLKEKVIIK